ncbi:MAG TPA: sugar ABC transporter permease [Limnochordia bacterium]|jgi:multiple sugar transport system permease protein|nr:sugar ABC transporter permease [Limnochordia bacterium]NLO95341.1 sugar ABC transporter permease [Bacillota bacterium]HOB41091.1 sugar ABC transporter permease [Limnochordia bacterium]HOK31893.1 sugar ABC transporter permease [Limnochordia bacterium]HOQ74488.1 sugar ABC transporter permease [Limnochordia bacterium]
MGTGKKRRDFTPFLFILPFMAFFLVFIVIPLIHGLLLSLQEWSLLSDPVFVGLDNYIELLDVRRFRAAVQNTFMFAVQSVPLLLVVPLVLALFLNKTFVGQKLAQNAIISPFLIPSSSVLLLWIWMLDSQTGMINQIFKAVGLPGQAWLSRQGSAMGVIVFVTLWWTAGYNIILFLSSLQDLPQDLYEAAAVDGASGWAQFWHITLPLLRNRMLFITTLQIIASFKLFDQVYILTGGGPAGSTRTLAFYLYETGFRDFMFGRAAAVSWYMFIMIAIFGLLQAKLLTRWLGEGV